MGEKWHNFSSRAKQRYYFIYWATKLSKEQAINIVSDMRLKIGRKEKVLDESRPWNTILYHRRQVDLKRFGFRI